MSNPKRDEIFYRAIQNKHENLKQNLDQFISSLVGENTQNKITLAATTESSSSALLDILHPSDKPKWLSSLDSALKRYKSKHLNAHQLALQLIKIHPELMSHTWLIDDREQDGGINFDEILKKYRAESRLDELFTEVIRILQQIHDSGEVESAFILNALSELIQTIRLNKNGSYYAARSVWAFITAFVSNYLWAEITKLPGLGSAAQALRETIEQAQRSMEEIDDNCQSEITKIARESSIKKLPKSDTFNPCEYYHFDNKLKLEHPKIEHQIDENV